MRVAIVGLLVFFSMIAFINDVMAMGERPRGTTFRRPNAAQSENEPSQDIKNGNVDMSKVSTASATTSANTLVYAEDELLDMTRAYRDYLSTRQFPEALRVLEKLPVSGLDDRKLKEKKMLALFRDSEEEAGKTNALFNRDGDIDESLKKMTTKLYREAQAALLAEKSELAKDLLIQILFLNRGDAKAKKLMENALKLKVGEYKVEDIEQKYWSKSSVSFYGGNYADSLEALNVLVFFDKENPLIYERMGSSYYMMGEKQKAVESWGTALYFNPGNKTLQDVVARAKKVIADEAVEAQNKVATKRSATKSAYAEADLQLMGMYRTQGEAYNYAAELKKRNLDAQVEEQDNGKWAVKVPKVQLQNK